MDSNMGRTRKRSGRRSHLQPVGIHFLCGAFEDTMDFDPGPGVDYHTSNGGTDLLLMKLLPDGTW